MISCPHSLYFFRGDVEKIDLDEAVNTLKDWHIVPLGRPVVNPPEQKTMTVDIPGTNGVLDLSNSLTRYPVFNNRTGSMKFAVLNDITDWLTAYTKIMRFLQGTPVKMILEDDLEYYYEGKVFVGNWNSRNDGTWSEVDLSYNLQPYRRSIYTSDNEDWLWDPFNFETDVITSGVFHRLRFDTSSGVWQTINLKDLVDMMPVNPVIHVEMDNHSSTQIKVKNSDLWSGWKTWTIPNDNDTWFYDLVFCELTPESEIAMQVTGNGYITVKFRSGRL